MPCEPDNTLKDHLLCLTRQSHAQGSSAFQQHPPWAGILAVVVRRDRVGVDPLMARGWLGDDGLGRHLARVGQHHARLRVSRQPLLFRQHQHGLEKFLVVPKGCKETSALFTQEFWCADQLRSGVSQSLSNIVL